MKKNSQKGFNLVELVVVIAILAIVAAVAIPNIVNLVQDSQAAACLENRRTILLQFSIESTKDDSVKLSDFLKTEEMQKIRCPGGGAYSVLKTFGSEYLRCSVHSSSTVDLSGGVWDFGLGSSSGKTVDEDGNLVLTGRVSGFYENPYASSENGYKVAATFKVDQLDGSRGMGLYFAGNQSSDGKVVESYVAQLTGNAIQIKKRTYQNGESASSQQVETWYGAATLANTVDTAKDHTLEVRVKPAGSSADKMEIEIWFDGEKQNYSRTLDQIEGNQYVGLRQWGSITTTCSSLEVDALS